MSSNLAVQMHRLKIQHFHEWLVDFILRCSETAWVTHTEREGWTVGATAYHIGFAHYERIALVQHILDDEPLPEFTFEDIHRWNQAQAQLSRNMPRVDVMAYLRSQLDRVEFVLDPLSDDELDKSAFFPLIREHISIDAIIGNIILGAAQEHFDSMKITLKSLRSP